MYINWRRTIVHRHDFYVLQNSKIKRAFDGEDNTRRWLVPLIQTRDFSYLYRLSISFFHSYRNWSEPPPRAVRTDAAQRQQNPAPLSVVSPGAFRISRRFSRLRIIPGVRSTSTRPTMILKIVSSILKTVYRATCVRLKDDENFGYGPLLIRFVLVIINGPVPRDVLRFSFYTDACA